MSERPPLDPLTRSLVDGGRRLFGVRVGVGVVRTFLALSVYLWHEGHGVLGFRGMDGQTAVESFFIISGFYMFMIMDGKYSNYFLFLSNRLLRLYPAYLAVLVLTAVALPVAHAVSGDWGCLGPKYCNSIQPYDQHWDALNPLTQVFLIVSHLSMLFQDVVFYLGSDSPSSPLYWALTYRHTPAPRLWTFMLIPQAWSISVEVYFYILIFFIHRLKTPWLMAVVLLGVAIKLAIYMGDLPDPWGDKFFPAELPIFFLGGLSYRLHKRMDGVDGRISAWVAAAFLLFMVSFQFIDLPALAKTYLCCALLTIGLPFLFRHSGGDPVDRLIGELSYPIYIVHQLVIFMAPFLFGGWIAGEARCLAGLCLTVALAYGLHAWINVPVEVFRRRRLERAAVAVGRHGRGEI